MNVGLLKMTYALNFVQSTTTYQKGNLKELYVNFKSKRNNIDNKEIRYASKLIQRKYARKEDKQLSNHHEKIASNF